MNPTPIGFRLLYGLIFLSGCSGLIYQVVWHKYLAILLGAQARATAIVLAIFLGGISAGYAVFGRWTRYKSWNLLKVYAQVELGLAVWAVMFPFLFKLVLPMTAGLYGILGLNSILIDFAMSILLIGFPTFLMGGTLPLLTQGLSKDLQEASQTHAKIYGFNTVGACLGCLFAGYVLIPNTSLTMTSVFGAAINFIVAAFSYFFYARRSHIHKGVAQPPRWLKTLSFTPVQKALLVVGFLSGFYLITLETVLIRLMGLSTGSSNYNFTLIVAIFIFGLGIGSFLVRNIAKYGAARLYWNQVGVSLSLLLLYISTDYWSYGVHVVRAMLRDLPESFYFYQALLGIGFTLLLVVPIGLSGLTLPLCFHLIKDNKDSLGERVGHLYGLNTVGCVLGAMLGGYTLLNFIDLDQLFKVCIFLSLGSVAASAYLYVGRENPGRLSLGLSSAILSLVVVGLFVSGRWSHERFIQPFRHPQPIDNTTFSGADAFGRYLGRNTEFLFWKDGPNTSVGIGASKYQDKEVSRTIFVNGKSDGNTRGDYFTTVMLAHIPGMLSKKMERVCVVGLGTGITIGTLAAYPDTKTIDVAEISNFSIENAHYFDPYNGGVSRNSKVKFNEMDAFRFLQGTQAKYDLVISEPSNPWVAGIENLYSDEFYEIAKSKMTEEALFVQWIHTYSFNDDLLRMVLRTMSNRFDYVSVFQLKGGDLALVGKKKPIDREDMQAGFARMRAHPEVSKMLSDAGVTRFETVLALEIMPNPLPKFAGADMPLHDLESPKLSNEAAKSFFVGTSSKVQLLRRQFKEFFPSLNGSLLAMHLGGEPPTAEMLDAFRGTFCDSTTSKTNFLCEETLAMTRLVNPGYQSGNKYDEVVPARDLANLDVFHKTVTSKFKAEDLQASYSMFELYKKFGSPIARVSLGTFLKPIELCLKTTVYTEELFGECLLQKILVLETVLPTAPEFRASVNQYLDWFPNLPKSSTNYGKLEEAKSILVKLVSSGALEKK